jgi:putative transposase
MHTAAKKIQPHEDPEEEGRKCFYESFSKKIQEEENTIFKPAELRHYQIGGGTDITYVPMRYGFMYLVAVIDWYSRYILAWELSNTLDSDFCVLALERALKKHGEPEIFNTDQGSQFTSEAFTSVLLDKQISISMDGRGRALDNVFIERLWWTVTYEDIYPKAYAQGKELYKGLSDYFPYYNDERKHSALDKQTPSKVFFETYARKIG